MNTQDSQSQPYNAVLRVLLVALQCFLLWWLLAAVILPIAAADSVTQLGCSPRGSLPVMESILKPYLTLYSVSWFGWLLCMMS